MPVRNGERTLREAIESVLRQTLTNLELIVVDDGSVDDSPSIARELARRDGRVRLVSQAALGIVAALQRGIRESRGSCIARMDADDICLPTRLAEQREMLETHSDLGLVSCLVEHLAEHDDQQGYRRHVDWLNRQVTAADIELAQFIESPLAHPSVMFRRELIDRFGGYRDGDFPEDYELWLRWLEAGVRMQKVPEILLRWRDLPGRLSRTDGRYDLEAFFRVKAKYLARWLARLNPHHPRIWLWGASRLARRRASYLLDEGIEIEGFIDLRPGLIGTRINGKPVISRERLPHPGSLFAVVLVSARDARAEIRTLAQRQGYEEGRHLIFAA